MIGNLNQLSFQAYGSIESERTSVRNVTQKASASRVLELKSGDAAVFCSDQEVWICNSANMTILSVSADGETFTHFYLDKVVCIRPGIRFALRPYQESSTVEVATAVYPQQVGTIASDDKFRIRRRMLVESIYTFFYQEKEKGFIFPGEAHAPLELTYVDKGSIHSVAEGMDILLNQGDLVIYAPNQWHMQYADVDVSPSFITITFDLAGEFPASLANRKFTVPQSAVTALQRMMREHDQMDEYSEDALICCLQILLLTMLREQNAPSVNKLRTANAVNSENEIIRRAQQFVGEHVREKLTVPLVARHVDVSPSYLNKRCRKLEEIIGFIVKECEKSHGESIPGWFTIFLRMRRRLIRVWRFSAVS